MKYCVIDAFEIMTHFESMVKATVYAYTTAMTIGHCNICDSDTGEVFARFDCDINDNVTIKYF